MRGYCGLTIHRATAKRHPGVDHRSSALVVRSGQRHRSEGAIPTIEKNTGASPATAAQPESLILAGVLIYLMLLALPSVAQQAAPTATAAQTPTAFSLRFEIASMKPCKPGDGTSGRISTAVFDFGVS